jgi:hypothetical protein
MAQYCTKSYRDITKLFKGLGSGLTVMVLSAVLSFIIAHGLLHVERGVDVFWPMRNCPRQRIDKITFPEAEVD